MFTKTAGPQSSVPADTPKSPPYRATLVADNHRDASGLPLRPSPRQAHPEHEP